MTSTTSVPLVAPDDDNYIDILSSAVGAAAGVYTFSGLSNLNDKVFPGNISLVLSAGAGSVIGTGLHTLLNKEPVNLFLVNSVVGATGAMIGCYAEIRRQGEIFSPYQKLDVLLTGGLAALGAGSAIAVKQRLTQQPRLGLGYA